MFPSLEVEDLPPSSSFYSAILQPLGLRYFSTEDRPYPAINYAHFSQDRPLFQIRQVVPTQDRPLRPSRIVLSAPSATAADKAYECALRANPDARSADPHHFEESYAAASGASASRTTTSGGGIRVHITDYDGNMVDVAYNIPSNYPEHHQGSTVRYTNSTTQEATRILDWNFGVAASSGPGSASSGSTRTASRRSYAKNPEGEGPERRRSIKAGSSTYEPAASARENSSGISAGAIAGFLGVAAAGAALTYNMVKSRRERERESRDEYDTMPPFPRRSTYPEDYDSYTDRKGRYVEVERAVDKVRYESDYPSVSDYRRPPPEYIARYSTVDSTRSRRDREAEDRDPYDDSRGRRHSTRSRASSSSRHPSESASHRDPYIIAEPEHRSYVSSRSSRHPPIVQRAYTYNTPLDQPDRDRDSYVSSRSHRSTSTLRAAPAPLAPSDRDRDRERDRDRDPYASHLSSHSRSASRVATTTYKPSRSRDRSHDATTPRSYSREGSYMSAHRVPLPDSRAPTYITTSSPYDIPLPDSRATSYFHPRDIPLPESRAQTYVSHSHHQHQPLPYEIPLPASRAPTYVSARHVPLPASRVGSKWDDQGGVYGGEEDDDADSLAPSDSISCVGRR